MGNTTSSSSSNSINTSLEPGGIYSRNETNKNKNSNNLPTPQHHQYYDDDSGSGKYRSFPGSAMLEKTFCGSIDTTDPSEYDNVSTMNRLLKRAEILCVSSPVAAEDTKKTRKSINDYYNDDEEENSIISRKTKTTASSGKLLARALVSEVTDNPKTMTQAAMQERERKLLKAAAAAAQVVSPEKKIQQQFQHDRSQYHPFSPLGPSIHQQQRKPIGVAAPPHVLRSVAYACTGDDDTVTDLCNAPHQDYYQSSTGTTTIDGATNNGTSSNTVANDMDDVWADHPNVVTIGVALSRQAQIYKDNNDSSPPIQGHRGTVSRQTQYDFNELQDRQYKYVSSVGPAGWRAGGAESGEGKLPDETHIPIIRIHCPTEASVDAVITALASGEIFIPHIQIMPEQLTVHNCLSTGSTNLVVQFGCERNDEVPVDEWPNWCLEFLHNQLYEYFPPTSGVNGGGAVWMKRSFSTTLAKQVRWKTVKHMNRYFASAEKVIAAWREMGPQALTPTPSHLEGGASVDEVNRPHGIYLYRGGVPTNYFCPNFEPPYTTKMTKSLLMTVLQKSWDAKRREWSSKPVPRIVEPSALCAAACGISTDLTASGYMAHEATTVTQAPPNFSTVKKNHSHLPPQPQSQRSQSPFSSKEPLSVVEFGRTFSEDVSSKENIAKSDATKKLVPHKHVSRTSPISRSNPTSTKSQDKRLLSLMDDTENSASVAPSAFNASVAESSTTVLHANSSNAISAAKPTATSTSYSKQLSPSPNNDHRQVMEISTGTRRLYSDEDFLDEMSSVDTPPALLAVTSPRGAAIAAEEQLQRQLQPLTSNTGNTKLSLVRNVSESPTSSPTKRAQMKLDREKRVAKQEKSSQMSYSIPAAGATSSKSNYKAGSVEPTPSLEYSTDGSSAFFHENPSVSVQHQSRVQLLQPLQSSHSASANDDDDESALLSLQESSSSYVSAVPTDEELFSVGWAKALDPNSGNYYYFTLDRTRTVWENPLSASQWGSELPPPVNKGISPIIANNNPVTHRPIDP